MGGSAPEAETPESEKLASRIGAQRWNQRYDDGYAQLEQEAIVDAGRNRHGLYLGRANADLAALEAKTVRANENRHNAMTFSRGTDATEASRLSAYNASGVADQEFRDRAMLGAIETGSNRAKNADLARGAVLQNDLSRSFSQAKAAMTVSQAQASSIGAVAGAGVMTYDDHRQMQKLNAMMNKPGTG